MGSFQQVVMGGICLVAAFWFGSYINEQPGAQQNLLQRFSNATVGNGTSHSQVPSQLVAKPQGGLLSSFLDTPAKPRPVTLSDLKARSTSELNKVVSQNPGTHFVATQELRLPEGIKNSATEVVSNFVKSPLPDFDDTPSFVPNNLSNRFVPNNHSDRIVTTNTDSDQQRLEIVPDFSTLAQDFKREQAAQFQRNDQLSQTPAVTEQLGSMLPVPKLDDFSRASFGQPLQQPNRDWNAVKQGVLSVEEKLQQFHKAHPVAEKFEPLRSEPLRSAESRFPVAATTTSGRFIPESRPARQEIERQEFERQEVERLELSLQEYERQELERQEAQRQEFRRRRPQAFVPDTSWQNAERPIPRNQLRTESQLDNREQTRRRRFERAHSPATSESFTQRQERWNVFGDRTQESKNTFEARDHQDDRYVQSQSAAEVRPAAAVNSIPEASRVRSLYNIPMENEARFPERNTTRQQDAFSNQNATQRPAQRQRIPSASLVRENGPEVVRYGDFETYVTESGDTLQTISKSFFGTPEYYFDLYLANRNVLVNPATVPAGVELRIPRMGE